MALEINITEQNKGKIKIINPNSGLTCPSLKIKLILAKIDLFDLQLLLHLDQYY